MNESKIGVVENAKPNTDIQSESQKTEEADGILKNSSEDRPNMTITVKAPYHERYYLNYRNSKRAEMMDLSGTKDFLQHIGFDGGELRIARQEKSIADDYRKIEENESDEDKCCSYCGIRLNGVNFFRLPSGRLRCNTCTNSIVKSKAEVKALFDRVVQNMDVFFGVRIDSSIDIEVSEEQKMRKKHDISPDTSSILGSIVTLKKGKYTIALENGSPRITLIMSIVYQLTRIWQYINWDKNKKMPRCPNSKRKQIYQGMSQWVMIQYLYLIGETNVAKRKEELSRIRKDECGVGFLMYETKYPLTRGMAYLDSTPFTHNCYPLDKEL